MTNVIVTRTGIAAVPVVAVEAAAMPSMGGGVTAVPGAGVMAVPSVWG